MKNGETRDATETVEKTVPACVPVKCNVVIRYVLMVTYHAPHTMYVMNIMRPSRSLRAEGITVEYTHRNRWDAISECNYFAKKPASAQGFIGIGQHDVADL